MHTDRLNDACRYCGVSRSGRNIDRMTMLPNDATDAAPFHMGDRIRKARELAGYMDLRSFATATELDRGALGRYEATGNVPRRSTLITIAWHTPVRLEWLETGKGPVLKDGAPNGGGSLPGLDSNQEPIGLPPVQLRNRQPIPLRTDRETDDEIAA